ncbi:MAG: oligosaccharide flippase family protein [Pseudomonadota bacterium]
MIREFRQHVTDIIRSHFAGNTLKGKVASSAVWLATANGTGNALRLLRNMILARLLAPEAFGIMATVIASVSVMEAFAEVGLKQSVIQNKKGADKGYLNITWWLTSLRGISLYTIAFFAAPLISQFFNKPDSEIFLRVGFLAILLNGLISPKLHVLQKNLKFAKWILVMDGAGVLGVTFTIILAFYIQSVWALVFGYTAEALLRLLLSFIVCPFKPHFSFDKSYLSDILKFSKQMFGLPILMMFFIQSSVFVIGRVLSLEELGMFTLARSLAEIPSTLYSRIISPVLLPTLSNIQDNKEKLNSILLKINKLTATLGIPFITFFIVFSKPLLSLVYGHNYSDVSTPFSILCIYTYIFICSAPIVTMYIATGKPGIHRNASALKTILLLILIYPVTKIFGLIGASFAILLAMCSGFLVQIVYAHKLIDFRVNLYIKGWSIGAASSLIVMLPGVIIINFTKLSDLSTICIGTILFLTAWIVGIAYLGSFAGKDRR